IGFILTLMAIILVLQNRQNVSDWFRGVKRDEAGEIIVDPEAHKGFLTGARERLAELWHMLAIGYLSLGFIIAALEPEHGFQTLSRATLVTVATLVVIHLLLTGVSKAVSQGFALSKDLKREFPSLEERTNSYLPIFERIIRALVWIVGGIVILS